MEIGISLFSDCPQGQVYVARRDIFPLREKAEELLARCVQDRYISPLVEEEDLWRFHVQSPTDSGWYRDPDLGKHLLDLGYHIEDLPTSYTLFPGKLPILWSFHHCWALLAWSLIFSDIVSSRQVRLLHFDAHDDMATPALRYLPDGSFSTPTSLEALRLEDPWSTHTFIRRGLVGIGGFIQPLLQRVPHVEMTHVVPAGEQLRSTEGGVASFQLNATSLRAFQAENSNPILLDIDLDYFCNELDNHREQRVQLDDVILSGRMYEFLALLEEFSVMKSVIGITCSLSAGFYPSRFWSLFFDILLPRLQHLAASNE
jgi:hypothetical protein